MGEFGGNLANRPQLDFESDSIGQGTGAMSDRLTSALLAALNESTEIKDSDWRELEWALRGQLDGVESRPGVEPKTGSENRFAATICSGMAKVRSNSEPADGDSTAARVSGRV